MARKRKGRPINGILLVDKPKTVSSNYVVQRVKRIFQAAKAGHTGALDPLATGLLPVCLGEATKFSQFLLDADKSYFVTAKLGQRTDTSDADGDIVETKQVDVSETDIKQAITHFVGQIKQVPSMFSALKFEGKPLYFYARKGINIDRPARDITIHSIEWIGLEKDELSLNVSCSKGTYIRTLIDDLGQILGCGAHVIVLRRTAVAHYQASQMISIQELEALSQYQQPKQDAASELACKQVSQDQTSKDSATALAENFDAIDPLLLAMDTPIQALVTIEIDDPDTVFFQQGRAINIEQNLDQNMQDDQVVRVYQTSNSKFLGVATVKDALMRTNTQTLTIHPKRVVVYS